MSSSYRGTEQISIQKELSNIFRYAILISHDIEEIKSPLVMNLNILQLKMYYINSSIVLPPSISGFIWTDETPLDYENWSQTANSSSGKCVVLQSSDGKWVNVTCDTEQLSYICKQSIWGNVIYIVPVYYENASMRYIAINMK